MLRRRRSISKTHPAPARKVPQRTCIACRQVKGKRELVRVVRTREGNIEIDDSGKKEGRGAYLCPARACWEAALKSKKLEHALKGSIPRDNREQLIKYGKDQLEGVD